MDFRHLGQADMNLNLLLQHETKDLNNNKNKKLHFEFLSNGKCLSLCMQVGLFPRIYYLVDHITRSVQNVVAR